MISTVTTYQYTCIECMYMYMYMYVCANENRTHRKVSGHIVLREAIESYLGLNEPIFTCHHVQLSDCVGRKQMSLVLSPNEPGPHTSACSVGTVHHARSP